MNDVEAAELAVGIPGVLLPPRPDCSHKCLNANRGSTNGFLLHVLSASLSCGTRRRDLLINHRLRSSTNGLFRHDFVAPPPKRNKAQRISKLVRRPTLDPVAGFGPRVQAAAQGTRPRVAAVDEPLGGARRQE